MSQQFTLQEVEDHNRNDPNNQFMVIDGHVYNTSHMPATFSNCKTRTPLFQEMFLVERLILSSFNGDYKSITKLILLSRHFKNR